MSDPTSMLAAADEATAAGDLTRAERLLREALALQERALGRLHPEVANTVNNLAVLCERLGKSADAERGYRRAHAIAVATLTPRDPLVATSLKNLVDFCSTHGIPLWKPPEGDAPDAMPGETPAAPEPPVVTAPPAVPTAPEAAIAPAAARTAGYRLSPRLAASLGLLAAGSVVVFAVSADWRTGSSSAAATLDARPAPAPARVSASPPPPVGPEAAVRSERPAPRAADPEPPLASPPDAAGRGITPIGVDVLAAQVCTGLERRGSPDWQCTPAGAAGAPGVFTFYTRVRVPGATTIQHRWYHRDRLHQTIRLEIGAGGQDGYRTYSRTTINAERAGEWRVELRGADGTVLDERRFTVR